MASETPTLLACLTPPGRGAIATLAVRGPLAWPITHELFRRNLSRQATAALPETPKPGKFWLGWLGEVGQGAADEVVLLVKKTTPDVHLELHCHGGAFVLQLLQEQYQSRGVQLVRWQDFERAVAPIWQIRAKDVLTRAPTVRTAAVALDQMNGAFVNAVSKCCERVASSEREKASHILRRLHELVGVGRHLNEPWRVVLAGAPNVGKSSLSNALAGFARSIVAPTPGTTRDVVTTSIALDGWPIELTDTAGLRASDDAIEQAGVTRARAALDSADLVVWLVDGSDASMNEPTAPGRSLCVINKIDLPPAWDWRSLPGALRVSAKTGAGVSELAQAIVQRLVPAPPQPGEAAPFTDELCQGIEAAYDVMQHGDDAEVISILNAICSP